MSICLVYFSLIKCLFLLSTDIPQDSNKNRSCLARFCLMLEILPSAVYSPSDPACDAEPSTGNCGEFLIRYFYDSFREDCLG